MKIPAYIPQIFTNPDGSVTLSSPTHGYLYITEKAIASNYADLTLEEAACHVHEWVREIIEEAHTLKDVLRSGETEQKLRHALRGEKWEIAAYLFHYICQADTRGYVRYQTIDGIPHRLATIGNKTFAHPTQHVPQSINFRYAPGNTRVWFGEREFTIEDIQGRFRAFIFTPEYHAIIKREENGIMFSTSTKKGHWEGCLFTEEESDLAQVVLTGMLYRATNAYLRIGLGGQPTAEEEIEMQKIAKEIIQQ